MRGYYLDASALIKRYATEPGTAEVVDLLREATDVHTASVAYAELIMAFRANETKARSKRSNSTTCYAIWTRSGRDSIVLV